MTEIAYPSEYYEFFIKFNEGDYYTCHDLLEHIWLSEKNNYFLKGLIQMCVALYHYGYGNVKGARVMMETSFAYIQPYRPTYWSLDLEKVNDFIKRCLNIIPQDIDKVSFEDVKTLPKLPEIYLYLED